MNIPIEISTNDLTSFLCNAAVETSKKLGTKAIITDTYSGRTARYLAAYRGESPVLAICYHEQSTRELALSYGVFPFIRKAKAIRNNIFSKLYRTCSKRLDRTRRLGLLSEW